MTLPFLSAFTLQFLSNVGILREVLRTAVSFQWGQGRPWQLHLLLISLHSFWKVKKMPTNASCFGGARWVAPNRPSSTIGLKPKNANLLISLFFLSPTFLAGGAECFIQHLRCSKNLQLQRHKSVGMLNDDGTHPYMSNRQLLLSNNSHGMTPSITERAFWILESRMIQNDFKKSYACEVLNSYTLKF